MGDVEAVRILIDQEPDLKSRVSPRPVHDPWHVAIVRDGQQLCNFVYAAFNLAVHNYYKQRRIEQNTDGRLVEIRHPVRLSGGIHDSIKLLKKIEPQLNRFERSFGELNQKAEFGQNDIYEELAKDALNFQDTIIPPDPFACPHLSLDPLDS